MTDDTMEAGRDLDALIAEKVFAWGWVGRCGYKWFAPLSTIGTMLAFPVEAPIREALDDDESEGDWWITGIGSGVVPRYSTDISAAWDVIDHIVANGFSPDVIHRGRGVWSCVIDRFTEPDSEVDPWPVHRDANSAPHAICLAALAAIEARNATEPAHV